MSEDSDDGVEPTTIYGFELPDGSEDETERDGFLSAMAEVHAVGIGTMVGLTGHLYLVSVFAAFLVGEFDGLRRQSAHIRDAAREPGYSLLGVVLGIAIHMLIWGGKILPGGVL